MKKIIVAIDGLKVSQTAIRYATQVAQETGGHLVGVFLEDFTYHSYSVYELAARPGSSPELVRQMNEQDKINRAKAIEAFSDICCDARITFSVHHEPNFALVELLHESIYADLLVIDKLETLSHINQDPPTQFIRELLIDVQCPVMVVADQFKDIEQVTLLYDGEPSSVFAIKMFGYLMPSFGEKPIEILSVKSQGQNKHLPDGRLMKEFMKRHFPSAENKVLEGDAETEIVKYLENKHQNELVVLGANRRNVVSRWFRPSMADVLMRELKTPLFIAHQ